MFSFSKETEASLNSYIFQSPYFHDAIFLAIKYDKPQKIVSMELFNPFEQMHINLLFSNVRLFLSIDTDKWCSDDSINVFVSEEWKNLPKALLELATFDATKLLALVLQSFSGNEIYVLCESITINRTRDGLYEPG